MASRFLSAFKSLSVEPVMLIDGACNQAMLLFIENVQMNKICSVNLGLPSEVCDNLSAHPEESVIVQKEFSIFAFYNSIILSVLPLIFVLFMGAWSDKYGRKIPLLLTLFGHVMYAAGYLINNWQTSWPVEVIYVVTLLDSLGGGNMGLFTSTISYISDISPEKSRTSRVSTANSMWYLGGPIGTLIGSLIIQYAGYNVALALVLVAYISAVLYVMFLIKESHGPFAKKDLQSQGSLKDNSSSVPKEEISTSTMIKDFFNWRRMVESFKTAFKKREGNTRTVLLAIIFSNMVRRVARGFFMYMFVRRALQWEATDYGYWVTYRNLLAALGSLFLVPLLTRLLSFTDFSLVVMGSVSIIGEYVCYGMITSSAQSFLMWLGPTAGLISNAGVIAFRSMSTKLVGSKEKGRISAVMSAMNSLMPMVGYAAYSPIYYKTVDSFPAGQFFFGASLNVLIMVLFVFLQLIYISSSYDAQDLESGEVKTNKKLEAFKHTTTVTLKSLIRTFSGPVEQKNNESSQIRNQWNAPRIHLPENLSEVQQKNRRNSQSANSENIFIINQSQSDVISNFIAKKNQDNFSETNTSITEEQQRSSSLRNNRNNNKKINNSTVNNTTATKENKNAATNENKNVATNENNNAATNENKNAATNENNNAATNENNNAATNENNNAATNENNNATTNENNNATTNANNNNLTSFKQEVNLSGSKGPTDCCSVPDDDQTSTDNVFYGIPLDNEPIRDINYTLETQT